MSADVQESDAPATVSFADRVIAERAITALINRAARRADEQKYNEWTELFTQEAVYSAITRENAATNGLYLFRDTGQRMLHMRAAYLLGIWQVPRGATTHLVSNLEIEVLDDTNATCVSCFIIARTGEMEMSKLHASGRYYDSFEKVDGEWKISVRDVVVDTQILPSAFTDLL